MNAFHDDTPIEGDDGSPDRLHRTQFAERVAKAVLLQEGSPGRVLSLEGEWGYGKTSVFNLIKKAINKPSEKDKPVILDFNPWLVGDQKNLIEQLLPETPPYTSDYSSLPPKSNCRMEVSTKGWEFHYRSIGEGS